MRYRYFAGAVGLGLLGGCGQSNSTMLGFGNADVAPPGDPSEFGGFPTQGPDDRPVVTAATTPPPVSGGTLVVTPDGHAIAADPDRDRVSIVDVPTRTILFTVPLQPGDEPGRVAVDDAGLAHVALRRAGAVASIDVATGQVVQRRAVCAAPRGIAYEASTKSIHVACANGDLVSLLAAGGAVTRRVALGADLRDVIVGANGLMVSRFKKASLVSLDQNGRTLNEVAPGSIERNSVKETPESGGVVSERLDADGAWRTFAGSDGSTYMLHQYALAEEIVIDPNQPPPGAPPASPYGANGQCSGLVQTAVTTMDANGNLYVGAPIIAPQLGVDAALSVDAKWVAIAHAGTADPNTVTPFSIVASGFGAVSIVSTDSMAMTSNPSNCLSPTVLDVPGQATAVSFNPNQDPSAQANAWMIVQTREPGALVIYRQPSADNVDVVDLGGPSMFDTGHEIFHRDSGAGIACASCHLEGHEDGRVWKFVPTGDRRTQAIDVGLAGTAPFHWDGDMTDFSTLMEQVFVHRMGGPEESPDRKAAIQNWVFSLSPPAPIVDPASAAAIHGKALFTSATLGCATCHSGQKFTSNLNAFVGTTDNQLPLQVPSLLGVGYRAPFLHDGRAATLEARFDPSLGGGDLHGHTSGLSSSDVADLVSYLESL